MSAALNPQQFESRLNKSFTATGENGTQETLELIEVKDLSRPSGADPLQPPEATDRVCFSVLFKAASDSNALSQGMYRFAHESGDSFSLFIVPVAAHSGGRFYEAVIN